MSSVPAPTVVRAGTPGKANPFTILVVSNAALESPWNSGTFVVDPITANRTAFDACVSYIEDVLFTGLAGQSEVLLADPAIQPHVRLLSLFVTGLAAEDANSFAAEDGVSDLLVARRAAINDFLTANAIIADIVYAISDSSNNSRASAWFTTDDDTRAGNPFTLDGVTLHHRHFYSIPGTIALHQSAESLTAMHEFQHAISSYTNGQIVDLYVDSDPGLNNKHRVAPAIPHDFGKMDAPTYVSDTARGPLGYPPTWVSYHCELHDTANPAVMDNYWAAPGGAPEVCQNDKITRMFIRDRLLAKIAR